ncbi:MAG: hypothetical protein JXB38_14835, partial [Anaerolineales bacterium]|nr:hypothetical protein [Anaerolineales bacterium]
MTTEDLLQKSIIAAETGDFGTAREILSRVVRDNPVSEWGWLALGYISPDPNMRAYCLGEVLRLNPYNKIAQDLLSEPFNPSAKGLGRLTGIMKSPPKASAEKANPARTAYLPMDGDEFPSTPSIPTVEEVVQTGELKAERQKAAEEQRAKAEQAPAPDTTPQSEPPVEDLDEPDWLIELEKAGDHEEVVASPPEPAKPQPQTETPVIEERKSEPVLPKSPFQGIPKPRWLDESAEEEQPPEDAFSPVLLQKAAAPPTNAAPARPPAEKPASASPINPNTQVIPELEEAAPLQPAAPEPSPAVEKPAQPPAPKVEQPPAAPPEPDPEPTPEPAPAPVEQPPAAPAAPPALRAEQQAQPPKPPAEKPEPVAPVREAAAPEPSPPMPDRPKPDWMAYQEQEAEKPPTAAPVEAQGLELPKVEFGPSAKAKPATEDPKRATIDMQPPGESKPTPDWLNELDEEIRQETEQSDEPKSSTMEIPDMAADRPKPDWLNKLEANYGIESDNSETDATA